MAALPYFRKMLKVNGWPQDRRLWLLSQYCALPGQRNFRVMPAFRKIYAILSPSERKRAMVLLGLMVIGMILETAGISLFIPAITLLIQGDIAAQYPAVVPMLTMLGNPSQQLLVIGGTLTLVCVYFIKTLYLAFLAWWQTRFAFSLQKRISQQLFTTYLYQPYTFHLQRNSAQLIRNATGEVSIFTYKTLLPGMLFITEMLVLLGVGSLLMLVEPVGAIIVALTLGGTSWGFHRATKNSISRWGEARQHHEGLRIQHLQEGLGGAKEVKLLGRESNFLGKYSTHNIQSARVGEYQITLQQLPRLWLELLAVTGMTLLILSMIAQDRDLLQIAPTLGLFAIAAFRLMPSMSRILGAVQSLRFGLPVINTLHEELNLVTPKTVEKVQSNNIAVLQKAVRLVDIGYTYPGASKPALQGLNVSIQQGETIGFIGSSGAGKSTLVDILLGLLTPDSGVVSVDSIDIRKNPRNWQDQIGYVPQNIFLTDDTLCSNIAFGLPPEQVNENAVWRAIQAAQLEDFVRGLPQGLETMVGERGVRLSGGQRQRIGIARSLYYDPEVLVLDEATSSLDVDTENEVMQAVRSLHGSKTIIIVAHRLSTVEYCDRLYRLEQGRVVEEGVPAEMLLPKTNIAISSAKS